MKRNNILFSTTRQWNPGDEFILMGTINLLKEVVGDFNPIIFNRNPEVRQSSIYLNPFRNSKYCNISFKGKGKIEAFFRIGFWDNSFKDEMNLDFVDMVVFAGSPEWIGKRLLPLYKKLVYYNKPIIYIGIGSGVKINFNDISSPYIDVLKKAKLITVRDPITYKLLKYLKPYYLPCPALFSSKHEKQISNLKKIGLIFASDKAVVNNKVRSKTYKYLINLYKSLMDKFECEIICHYIDELPEAIKQFPNSNIYYSCDSKDYIEIYKNFDLVIGPRVHGIGISASLGIPGILITHDLRGETGKGFLAKIISVGEPYNNIINEINKLKKEISRINREIIEYKNENRHKFISLLKETLK